MKKRSYITVLCLVLSVMLCLAVMPVTAFAENEEDPTIWVDGQKMQLIDREPTSITCGEGKATFYYDVDEGLCLLLENVTITQGFSTGHEGSWVYAGIYSEESLNIYMVGANTINLVGPVDEAVDGGYEPVTAYGIFCKKSLKLYDDPLYWEYLETGLSISVTSNSRGAVGVYASETIQNEQELTVEVGGKGMVMICIGAEGEKAKIVNYGRIHAITPGVDSEWDCAVFSTGTLTNNSEINADGNFGICVKHVFGTNQCQLKQSEYSRLIARGNTAAVSVDGSYTYGNCVGFAGTDKSGKNLSKMTFSEDDGYVHTGDGTVAKYVVIRFSLEDQPVFVGNAKMTEENLTVACDEGSATLDLNSDIATLTLNNVRITKYTYYEGSACGLYVSYPLTVMLVGENTMNLPNIANVDYIDGIGGYSSELIIDGDGSLSIEIGTGDFGSDAIYADVLINRAKIDCRANCDHEVEDDAEVVGIWCTKLINEGTMVGKATGVDSAPCYGFDVYGLYNTGDLTVGGDDGACYFSGSEGVVTNACELGEDKIIIGAADPLNCTEPTFGTVKVDKKENGKIKLVMPEKEDAVLTFLMVTSQVPETVLYGDVNGDEKVNASDALMTLKAAVNKITLDETQFMAADVNGDEKVNASDALLILKFSVKKIDSFPVEK